MTRKVASENHIGVSMEDYAPGSALLGEDGGARGLRPADSDGVSTALVASAQVVGVAVLVLTVVWVSLFLGGTSLSAEYPDLIFNVSAPCPSLPLASRSSCGSFHPACICHCIEPRALLRTEKKHTARCLVLFRPTAGKAPYLPAAEHLLPGLTPKISLLLSSAS